MRKGYVQTPRGRMHYRIAGDTGPVVALFHESPLTGAIFDKALPYFEGKAIAVAFDNPGYGGSEAPPDNTAEIPEYASRLLDGMAALGFERFAVGGGHTGASLALSAYVQAKERVTHVVLSGVPLLTPEERAHFLATWSPDMPIDPEGSHFAWAWERYRRIWHRSSPVELTTLGASALLQNFVKYNWAYNAAFRHDPTPDVPQVTCPVLMLQPEKDLLIHTDTRVLGMLPGAKYVVRPGLYGQLPWRDPEFFAEQIIDFISP